MAFNILDTDGDGEITLDEIMAIYDTSWHPEVGIGAPRELHSSLQMLQPCFFFHGCKIVSSFTAATLAPVFCLASVLVRFALI